MNLPNYDSWKTRSPYDEMSPLDEAAAEIDRQHETISRLVNLLDECCGVLDELLADPTAEGRARALVLVAKIEGLDV